MTKTAPVLSAQDVERYRQDGYLRVPNLASSEAIDRVKAMIYRLYRRAVPADAELDHEDRPWETATFDAKLAGLRERDRQTFGALYDAAQNNLATVAMLLSDRAVQACADALGDTPDGLSCSGLLLRMDPPNDKRSVLEWHQDRAFFPQNFHGRNGIVMTLFLSDTDEEVGAMQICPGSHLEKYHPPVEQVKTDHYSTEQRRIDESLVARYTPISAVGKAGDAYLFDMNTFHRSGRNTSDRIRFSALMRFHRMFADDYVPHRWVETYNQHVLKAVEAKFS
jgi:ectoine hydroxylase-related dioxygenase (phytanoyl-CoA dioxygenase family)